MPTEEISDLISRSSLGDQSAFIALYQSTNAKLFGVCLRILRNQAEAEDALQEVYIKIWRNAGRFSRSNYSAMSWLIAIARNHAIDLVRARKPETVGIDEETVLTDDQPDPESAAMNTSEGRRIDHCLEELDQNHASAVREAYVEGYSYAELAANYKVPMNTMRTWLRRSLIRLRECLER